MRSLVFIAGGWLLPILVFLLATPVLVGHLGFAGFGVFALAGVLVAAGASLDLGLATLAVRQLARSRRDAAAFAQKLAALNSAFLGLAVMAALAVWTLAEPVSRLLRWHEALPAGDAVAAARWTGLWLAVAFINVGLTSGLRAVERFDLVTLLGAGAMSVTWFAAALGAALGLGTVQILALVTAVAVLQTLLTAATLARLFGRWPHLGRWPRFEPGSARFAGSAFVGQATSLATYHADKAIVSALLGTTAAGMYTAAANIANKPLGFVAALAGVLFPRIATLESQGRGFRSARTYLAASRMLAAISTFLLACGLVLAGDFILLWLGPDVPERVTTAFRILLGAYWLSTLSVAPSSTLAGQGNTHRGAAFALAGGLLTLALCLLLVPRWGLVGAAVAGLLGMSQAAVFELWAHHEAQSRHRFARFALRRTAAALALAAAGAAAAAALVRITLPMGWTALLTAGGISAAAFTGLWFGSGLAVREERMLLGRAVRWLRQRRR